MSKKFWGGRFSEEDMDPEVIDFTTSIDVDVVLAEYDCFSTRVHVETLHRAGYLSKEEAADLDDALEKTGKKIKDGTLPLEGFEDIHSAIQSFVEDICPSAGKKMHTGRSRNEQIVNDVRLYCKEMNRRIKASVRALQKALVGLASENTDVLIPGYTHLNRAQPVLFSHLLLSYVEMLERDASRLEDAFKRTDISVMGSGALAGSALELDRKFTAEKLGFRSVSSNSMDAVSDRDFMVETAACLSIIAVHLSRVSEDLILYSTDEFAYIEIGGAYCTGSSLMPQKKNPDVFELIRGRAGGVISGLNSLLILLKGLPHTYNRDLQEDKKALFSSFVTVETSLSLMSRAVGTIKVDRERGAAALDSEFIYATDIAEYLVKKGAAFKDAHDIVGGIVRSCLERRINISDLSISELKGFSGLLEEDVYSLLEASVSVGNKRTAGSTNPKMVSGEIKRWNELLRSEDA